MDGVTRQKVADALRCRCPRTRSWGWTLDPRDSIKICGIERETCWNCFTRAYDREGWILTERVDIFPSVYVQTIRRHLTTTQYSVSDAWRRTDIQDHQYYPSTRKECVYRACYDDEGVINVRKDQWTVGINHCRMGLITWHEFRSRVYGSLVPFLFVPLVGIVAGYLGADRREITELWDRNIEY